LTHAVYTSSSHVSEHASQGDKLTPVSRNTHTKT